MVVLTSFAPPAEGVRHTQPNTEAHVGPRQMGNGTLYVAESRVSWVSEAGQGFSLEYPAISLHAVSKDLSSFPQEHLYLMIDGQLNDIFPEEENQSEEEDEYPMTEVRFVPADKTTLEIMYRAMCDCQALHPDPEQDSLSEEGEFYDDEDGAENLTPEGQAQLERLSNMLNAGDNVAGIQEPVVGRTNNANGVGDGPEQEEPMDQGQFEDAE